MIYLNFFRNHLSEYLQMWPVQQNINEVQSVSEIFQIEYQYTTLTHDDSGNLLRYSTISICFSTALLTLF